MNNWESYREDCRRNLENCFLMIPMPMLMGVPGDQIVLREQEDSSFSWKAQAILDSYREKSLIFLFNCGNTTLVLER